MAAKKKAAGPLAGLRQVYEYSTYQWLDVALDDAGFKRVRADLGKTFEERAKAESELSEKKTTLGIIRAREKRLVEALATGTDHVEVDDALLYADDAAGTVTIVDETTGAVMGTRPIRQNEMQGRFEDDPDYGADDE